MRNLLVLLTYVSLAAAQSKILLRENWAIQSSVEVREDGAALSTPGFAPRGWHAATVPTTVFSALVKAGVYPDPYFGTNLRSAPGTSYPVGVNFSNLPMPSDSPFNKPWWFRTTFRLPAEYRGKTLWLNLDGVNFRANVWLNGKKVASSDKLAGAWRLFQLDVTSAARPAAANALAIEIFPPEPGDLAVTFVDWNPMPPDKGMGLWRGVSINATGPVAIRYPFVTTHLQEGAQLSVRAELTNAGAVKLEGVLKGRIEGLEFSQPETVAAHETKIVYLTPPKISSPRVWWPAQTGPQNLYPLDLSFEVGGKLSDASHTEFG
ncbi:MAG TPA: hypothetical protein VGF49_24290, partial [Candidatus Solibacter sp.]